LLLLVGCQALPPPEIRSAPAPTLDQVLRTRAIQTRVVTMPTESLFPRVINVLMDSGYVVRAADAKLGLVSFYQQWTDSTQANADIFEEGSMLLQPAGPGSTQIRVMLTGGWQQENVSKGGVATMYGSVQQHAAAGEYKRFLDMLESGLKSNPQ
jgi:hypothetical protein